MKPVKAAAVAVTLFTFAFVLFSALHLGRTRRARSDAPRYQILQVPVGDGKTSTEARVTVPDSRSWAAYDKLRETIPQNGAYWNRLFYAAVRRLGNGEAPVGRAPDWARCRESNQELLRTNVHDVRLYPAALQDFLQIMTCRSPPLLINQPNKCAAGEGGPRGQTALLFGIKSLPGNFEQRQAVRKTWGREGLYRKRLRVHTVFLLGSSLQDDRDLDPLLSFESQYFGDLLQWDVRESLLNLTHKGNAFLEWALKHCPRVSFVFSGDDDVFVNSPALFAFLESLEPSEASRLYVGQVLSAAVPFRDPKSKYYVPTSFYDGPYPPYVGGGGYVVSGALLQPLLEASRVIPLFPMDDVYTGMCAQAAGARPEENPGFKTFDVKEDDRENLCVHKGLILIHQRSPQQIKKLWNGIHNPLLTC